MIIVTGTKRSGTSMWMQILRAAGFPVIGHAFPKDWQSVIGDANREGFFESPLRQGIHFRTNPDPRTGNYIHPDDAKGHAVKVFVPGLVRSDLAFIERVVATMRNWREYHWSLERLYALENENRAKPKGRPTPVYVPPVLEWWAENYSLIADHLTRRYPLHCVAYDRSLAEPARYVREVIDWLGIGDAEAAVAAVKPELRTQSAGSREDVPEVEPRYAEVFDELYARVVEQRPLDEAFIDVLNETNEALRPRIESAMREVVAQRREAMKRRAAEESGEEEASSSQGPPPRGLEG